jgi:hypothetical protein
MSRFLYQKERILNVETVTSRDHKKVENTEGGPEVRPIMGAMVGPNVGLTNFGCIIVRAITDDYYIWNVSKSTEETVSKLEEYNKCRFK